MEAEKEQSWKLRVTAKAKHFNFRFRFRFAAATNYYASTPTLSFFHFSILLNLRHFILRITSEPIKQQQQHSSFKFIKFLQRFRPRFPFKKKKKNKSNVAPPKTTATTAISNLSYLMDPRSRIGCWMMMMMGFLACIVQFISMNTMIASLGFSVASILLKKLKFNTLKLVNLAGAATMVCYLLYSYNYWEYFRRLAWDK